MSKVKYILVNILIMLALIAIIGAEFYGTYRTLYNRKIRSVQVFSQAASDIGKTRITLEELVTYDEVPYTQEDADEVIAITDDREVRLRISGALSDTSYADYGYYYYINHEGATSTLTVSKITDMIDNLPTALHDYWYGNQATLLSCVAIGDESAGLSYMQCTHLNGNYPVIYNETAKLYYMIIDMNTYYFLVSAPDPFLLTSEKVTAHFGIPKDDPQLSHNYSGYEEVAAQNTITKLLDKDKDKQSMPQGNPYTSTALTGSKETYTSVADGDIRDKMIELASYKWNPDGTSSSTKTTVDVVSDTAKQSQWNITASSYSYESNALRISMLSGSRSNTSFTLSGNINNTLNTERPFVLLVKLLNAKGELLGLKGVDNRAYPILGNGVTTFNFSISNKEMNIGDITAVQFEVY